MLTYPEVGTAVCEGFVAGARFPDEVTISTPTEEYTITYTIPASPNSDSGNRREELRRQKRVMIIVDLLLESDPL